MSEGKQDYYKVGSRDSIVISSSCLKHINPLEGGSPLQFIKFFDENVEEMESKSLRLGKMIHLWAEDKENFHVSEVPKPSEVMGLIADRVIEHIRANGEVLTREMCSDISLAMNYQSRWTLETRLKNVYDGVQAYVNEKIEAETQNKIYLTETEKNTIEACCNAIAKHPLAKNLLFMQDSSFTDLINLKEQEVYWERNGTLFKAKLDDITINHELKVIFINDLKSMSSSVYQYKNFKYYRTWRQLAFYGTAVREYCAQNSINIEGYEWSYNVIGVETGLLNQCVVWKVKQEWITRGIIEIKSLVGRIKWHIQEDQWDYQKEEVENGYFLEMPYEEED